MAIRGVIYIWETVYVNNPDSNCWILWFLCKFRQTLNQLFVEIWTAIVIVQIFEWLEVSFEYLIVPYEIFYCRNIQNDHDKLAATLNCHSNFKFVDTMIWVEVVLRDKGNCFLGLQNLITNIFIEMFAWKKIFKGFNPTIIILDKRL